MKLLSLFFALLWVGVAHAQKEPIGFKDFALGGTFSEFKARFPDFSCEGGSCRFEMKTACISKAIDVTRPSQESFKLAWACRERNTYGGIPPRSMTASFKDDKLTQVLIAFTNGHYDALTSALITRFGQPSSRAHDVMQNLMGAKFDNEVLTWTPASTLLRISKYSSNIEEGSVLITTAEEFAEWRRKQKQAAEKGAKDL